jgi:ribosomal protein S18 acetylase RimI-like enzyme
VDLSRSSPKLSVRTAVVADVPSIAAIGSIGFPAVHEEIVGAEFAAAVVEQTYSTAALGECIRRCAEAEDAEFLVAEQQGEVVGFLHYDSAGAEPELHRIYVDLRRKRAGVGTALMRELHERLPAGRSYVLLVAEANRDAQAFYRRHGLVVERSVDGISHHRDAIGLRLAVQPPVAPSLLMRYTKHDGS